MYYIGIDIGGSFVKGAVLNTASGNISHVKRFPVPTDEQMDFAVLFKIVKEMIDYLLSKANRCQGVVFCNQMHGLVLINKNKKVVSPCYTWRYKKAVQESIKGKKVCNILDEKLNKDWLKQTGWECQANRPIGLLYYLKEQGKIPHGDIYPYDIGSAIIIKLCNNLIAMHPTNASAHGCYNLKTNTWHNEIIKKLQLTNLSWPEISGAKEPVGMYKFKTKDIPCYAAIGDQQCALFGGKFKMGELSLNIGTGSQISCLKKTWSANKCQVRPYLDGNYLHTVTHIPAGRSLYALEKLFRELAEKEGKKLHGTWQTIKSETSKTNETDVMVNLSFFQSSVGNKGSICNLTEEKLTIGNVFLAAFKNMAEEYKKQSLNLGGQSGWNRLIFSGGVANSFPVLKKLIYDNLKISKNRKSPQEDTLHGLMNYIPILRSIN